MSDSIRVQVEVKVRVPQGRKLSRALMEEVLNAWISDGDMPDGMTVKAFRFARNGARWNGHARTPKQVEQMRVLLQKIPFQFSKIRIS